MSTQDKQHYLREAVLDNHINPQLFFQHWESLQLELEEVSLEQLQLIVQKFLSKRKTDEQVPPESADDEEDFTDFQEPEEKHNPHQQYADFNWDFLNTKTSPSKTNQPSEFQPPKITKTQQSRPSKVKKSQPKSSSREESQPNQRRDKEEKSGKEKVVDLIEVEGITEERRKQEPGVTVKEVLQKSQLSKIKCLQLQPNVLQHHSNVEIVVSRGEQVEDKNSGFLEKFIKSTQYLFVISTVARNRNRAVGISWEVKRTNGHFEWLRSMLFKFYPGIVVPPLPQLPKTLDKMPSYRTKLEHFLIDCYRCPELRNSKYFEAFLSYNNLPDLEAFIKKSQTIAKPKNLSHVLNMQGTVETLYSDSIQQYGVGLQSFLNRSSQHLKKVRQILADINLQYSKISQQYRNLGSVFMEMSQQSCGFSQQKCYHRLTKTYKQVAVVAGEHSALCEQQRQLIDAYMSSHFAYQKDRLDNMHGLINKRNLFATELAQRPRDSDGKGMLGKLASFFGEKAEQVETPSSQYETLKAQVGYYNNQLLRQSLRMVTAMTESHVEHFSGYGMTRIDSVDKLQQKWSQIMVQLSKLHVDQ